MVAHFAKLCRNTYRLSNNSYERAFTHEAARIVGKKLIFSDEQRVAENTKRVSLINRQSVCLKTTFLK